MRQLAGKYAKELLEKPVALMATGGLGAAGLATLGNIGSGEARYESPARTGLEALGAGVVGAAAARAIPSLARYYSPKATKQRFKDAGEAMSQAGVINSAKDVEDYARIAASASKIAPYVGGTLGTSLMLGAGGFGGQVGGGLANVGNMAGLPIDPELPGSSNTINSRLNMQGYV
jgi:hypothetical protein|tara:strand:- start:40 stop:564 length:525 start_codon:yes stop_codon:yes gene_type:complete